MTVTVQQDSLLKCPILKIAKTAMTIIAGEDSLLKLTSLTQCNISNNTVIQCSDCHLFND